MGGCASQSQVLLLLPFVGSSQLCQWVGSRLQWSARRPFFDCAHIVSPCFDCCIYCTVYGRHHPLLLNHLNFISTQNRTAMSSSLSSLLFVLVVLLFCWCSVDQVTGQNNKKNGHKSSSSALSSSNKLPPWHVRFARQQGYVSRPYPPLFLLVLC